MKNDATRKRIEMFHSLAKTINLFSSRIRKGRTRNILFGQRTVPQEKLKGETRNVGKTSQQSYFRSSGSHGGTKSISAKVLYPKRTYLVMWRIPA